MHLNDQKQHVKWVTECKSMFQILEEKNPLPCTYKRGLQRWGKELQQVSISLQKILVIFWSSISSGCSSVKCRVVCRMPRTHTEQLQKAGGHCAGLAGSSGSPAPAPLPPGTWAALPPGDSPLLPPLHKPTSGKDFLPPLSGAFLHPIGRSDLPQVQPDFWVSCRFPSL